VKYVQAQRDTLLQQIESQVSQLTDTAWGDLQAVGSLIRKRAEQLDILESLQRITMNTQTLLDAMPAPSTEPEVAASPEPQPGDQIVAGRPVFPWWKTIWDRLVPQRLDPTIRVTGKRTLEYGPYGDRGSAQAAILSLNYPYMLAQIPTSREGKWFFSVRPLNKRDWDQLSKGVESDDP
jgi:hypothetical protein